MKNWYVANVIGMITEWTPLHFLIYDAEGVIIDNKVCRPRQVPIKWIDYEVFKMSIKSDVMEPELLIYAKAS